jgi:hypothetical protein
MARSEASVAPDGPPPMMPTVWIEFLVATQNNKRVIEFTIDND